MNSNEVKLVQLTPIELENLILDSLKKYDRIKLVKEEDTILLSKKEVMERLSISFNTLQRKINSGILKIRPDGKITEKALNDFLNM